MMKRTGGESMAGERHISDLLLRLFSAVEIYSESNDKVNNCPPQGEILTGL